MKTRLLATLGATVLAMGASLTASQAQIISQPGESMGVALGAPLPEGVFFVDLESYGKRDGSTFTPNANGVGGAYNPALDGHLGVNIPLIAWSTPFSFYDTRLEILYAAPFTHVDTATANLNRVDIYSQLFGPLFAHSFGNGFNVGLLTGIRTEDNFTQASRGTAADIRLSFGYVKDGIKAVATFAYSGNFGGKTQPGNGNNAACKGSAALGSATSSNGAVCGFNDNVYVDYTLTKTFGKIEFGLVGYAQTDIRQVQGAGFGRAIAVGGLLGYDFGKVTAQAMVTREVAASGLGSYGLPGRYDTRGWLRLIVPLYVAPVATPVVARY